MLMLLAAIAGLVCEGTPPARPLDASAPHPAIDALPLATLDETLRVEGEVVPAREQDSRLSIPVTIGGRGPFRFIVDSGADRTVIGRQLAARLGFAASGCVRLHSIAGLQVTPTVRVSALRIGSTVRDDFEAPTLPEAYLKSQGMIGIDTLLDQRVSLDFSKNTISVEDARTRMVEGADDIVVTARRQRGQLILAEASSGATSVLAVIDTGAEITMGNSALRARIVGRHASLNVKNVELTSVTGQKLSAELITLPELTIGRLRLKNIALAFADAPPFQLFGLADKPAVLLGTDVLQSFRAVTLDFRRRRVRFSLR